MSHLPQDKNHRNYYIKYHPRIKQVVGSEKVVILIDRLEYWFQHKPEGFYKFIEPCNHRLYRQGDSWCEELSITRPTFNKAFAQLGIRYRSKSTFQKATDKFQGKLYAYYFDCRNHLTHFVRHHETAQTFLADIFSNDDSEGDGVPFPSKSSSTRCSQQQDIAKTCQTPPIRNVVQHQNEKLHYGKEKKLNDGLIKPSKNNDFQTVSANRAAVVCIDNYFRAKGEKVSVHKETPCSNNTNNAVSSRVNSSDNSSVENKMKKIWIEEIGEIASFQDKPALSSQLREALQTSFKGELNNWQRYCRIIASSKFLMGEKGKQDFKKIWITWAIKPETIERIRLGEFTLGDRNTKLDEQLAKVRDIIKQLANEKDLVTSGLNHLKWDLQKQHRSAISKYVDQLSKAEETQLKQEFENQAKQRTDAVGEEFRESGWNSPHTNMMYGLFLRQKSSEQLFGQGMEEATEEAFKRHPDHQKLTQDCISIEAKLTQLKSTLRQLIVEREATLSMSPVGYGLREENLGTNAR